MFNCGQVGAPTEAVSKAAKKDPNLHKVGDEAPLEGGH